MPTTTLYPPLSSDGGVLPAELEAKFKQIQDITHAQRQLQEKEGRENDSKSAESKINIHHDEEAAAAAKELDQRKLQLAVEAAVECESEISRLAKGVSELEDLLARQEGAAIDPLAISYPSLPSVIPYDKDEA